MANICLNLVQLRGPRAALLAVLEAGPARPEVTRCACGDADLTDHHDAVVLDFETRWSPAPAVAAALSERHPDLLVDYVYSEVCRPYHGHGTYRGGEFLCGRHVEPSPGDDRDDLADFPAIAGYRFALKDIAGDGIRRLLVGAEEPRAVAVGDGPADAPRPARASSPNAEATPPCERCGARPIEFEFAEFRTPLRRVGRRVADDAAARSGRAEFEDVAFERDDDEMEWISTERLCRPCAVQLHGQSHLHRAGRPKP